MEQLKKVVWTGSNASNNENKLIEVEDEKEIQEQIRRRRGQLQQQEGIEISDEAIYNNVNFIYFLRERERSEECWDL